MPKLAIYVPQDEIKKIDRWRKKINFSRVFMQALGKEIQRLSKAAPNHDKLTQAAAHYGQQLSDGLSPVRDFGIELGTADVLECRLSAAEVQEILRAGEPASESDAALHRVLKRHKKALDNFGRKGSTDDGKNPGWRASLREGYVEGVKSAWDEVCRVMNG